MAVKKLAGLVKQSSKKVEGERCEHVKLRATARSFNVRLRAGRAVPRTKCGGGRKTATKTPQNQISQMFLSQSQRHLCAGAVGKAVWCWLFSSQRTSGTLR